MAQVTNEEHLGGMVAALVESLYQYKCEAAKCAYAVYDTRTRKQRFCHAHRWMKHFKIEPRTYADIDGFGIVKLDTSECVGECLTQESAESYAREIADEFDRQIKRGVRDSA